MRPNTLFLAAGVLALAFGLGFLLAPAAVLPVYGAATDPATLLMSRFFGVALVQLGLTLYLIREVRDGGAVRALCLAGVLGSVLGALVAFLGVRTGVTNGLGWSTVAIYVLLLVGYAGCLRGQPGRP
jgi:FtsH-binding integral membrane protein